MPQSSETEFAPAHFVDLRIRPANGTARLRFAKVNASSLVVTIPTHDLVRLHHEILRKLRKVPELFALVSKTDHP